MKVGDYVRFDYHRVSAPIQIAKITEKFDAIMSEDDSVCYSTDVGLVIDESNLVKEPSKNPIDLIEVGDYVNGHLVIDKNPNAIYIEDSQNKLAHIPYTEKDIKSVLTKEQFEKIEYKVGE